MKFVNKKEFYELSENTLYSKFKSNVIEGLYIKGETIEALNDCICFCGSIPFDYVEVSLIDNIDCNGSSEYFDICDGRKDFVLDYNSGARNGMFDRDEEFVVYDKEDIQKLINTLQELIK